MLFWIAGKQDIKKDGEKKKIHGVSVRKGWKDSGVGYHF